MNTFANSHVPSLEGQTYVITGATGGIGSITAKVLAGKGARVILAVRNEEKGQVIAASMRGDVEVRHLDLADLSSVRDFSDSFTDPIDVLINNAGISIPPLRRTVDGFESQIGTNHLGHFALTNLLLPRISNRVVTIGSLAYRIGRIDFRDLNWNTRAYSPYAAYGQSKLANHLFAHELQQNLETVGSSVRSLVAHPGIATTNLMDGNGRGIPHRIQRLLIHAIAQTAEAGAQPSILAATLDLPGGSHIGPSRLFGIRGQPGASTPPAKTVHAADAGRLWRESEELTGTIFPLSGPRDRGTPR